MAERDQEQGGQGVHQRLASVPCPMSLEKIFEPMHDDMVISLSTSLLGQLRGRMFLTAPELLQLRKYWTEVMGNLPNRLRG